MPPNFNLYWISKSAVYTEEVLKQIYVPHSLTNWLKKLTTNHYRFPQ